MMSRSRYLLKALRAQAAGAGAVIIVNTRNSLRSMRPPANASDEEALAVRIPVVIVPAERVGTSPMETPEEVSGACLSVERGVFAQLSGAFLSVERGVLSVAHGNARGGTAGNSDDLF
jgi:hypothetical protein